MLDISHGVVLGEYDMPLFLSKVLTYEKTHKFSFTYTDYKLDDAIEAIVLTYGIEYCNKIWLLQYYMMQTYSITGPGLLFNATPAEVSAFEKYNISEYLVPAYNAPACRHRLALSHDFSDHEGVRDVVNMGLKIAPVYVQCLTGSLRHHIGVCIVAMVIGYSELMCFAACEISTEMDDILSLYTCVFEHVYAFRFETRVFLICKNIKLLETRSFCRKLLAFLMLPNTRLFPDKYYECTTWLKKIADIPEIPEKVLKSIAEDITS